MSKKQNEFLDELEEIIMRYNTHCAHMKYISSPPVKFIAEYDGILDELTGLMKKYYPDRLE